MGGREYEREDVLRLQALMGTYEVPSGNYLQITVLNYWQQIHLSSSKSFTVHVVTHQEWTGSQVMSDQQVWWKATYRRVWK